jgi:sodium-independent sulfate anion transporter 11
LISFTDLGWFSGDVIAGLTVGLVLVPQGLSYALVNCSSVCLCFYSKTIYEACYPTCRVRTLLLFCWRAHLLCKPKLLLQLFLSLQALKFFATTKDVSIGPVAVMSITVAHIIQAVESKHPGEWAAPQIAIVLAFLSGFIVLGLGLLRLGWLVEFIPLPAISGFMTGSALNIAVGQVPGLMGITGFK